MTITRDCQAPMQTGTVRRVTIETSTCRFGCNRPQTLSPAGFACILPAMQRVIAFILLELWSFGLLGCATSGRHLVFDVHPCAGEVHLALADVQVVDGAGKAVTSVALAGAPHVFLRDGDVKTELGQFEPGCGGGLRVHVRLPETKVATPVIELQGKLTDGAVVTGSRKIVASEYR